MQFEEAARYRPGPVVRPGRSPPLLPDPEEPEEPELPGGVELLLPEEDPPGAEELPEPEEPPGAEELPELVEPPGAEEFPELVEPPGAEEFPELEEPPGAEELPELEEPPGEEELPGAATLLPLPEEDPAFVTLPVGPPEELPEEPDGEPLFPPKLPDGELLPAVPPGDWVELFVWLEFWDPEEFFRSSRLNELSASPLMLFVSF